MNLLGMHVPFTGRSVSFAENKPMTPSTDVAWSEDAIFQPGIKSKYNPDDLIGKKGYGIYRKMMLDEQVKAVVKFKRDAITSRDYSFYVDVNELGADEAERRINIADAYLEKMIGTPVDAFNGIMTAVWQGVSYTEKNLVQIEIKGKTYWGINTLKLKPFDTFEFEVNDFGNVEKLKQKINGREQDLDITKFIHHVQNPEYDAQYGQSELREAYRAWFSKDMAITFYNMWLERSASGFKWIKTKSLPNTAAYNALQSVLMNTVNGAGMILGKDDEFNIEFPSNNVAFKDAIDMHDLGIARAMLVPNLMGITPAGQTGSFSQSDTQLEAFLWTLDQDATRLEEVLNEQLFRQLGALNFGDDFWPRIKFAPISEKRKIQIISIWKDLVTSGAVKVSDSDENHIREQLDFPERDDESVKNDDNNGTTKDNDGNSDNGNTDNGDNGNTPENVDMPDETIIGKNAKLYSKSAFTKAIKRVDFKVIQRASEALEIDRADEITGLFYKMAQDVTAQFRDAYSVEDEKAMASVKFDKRDKTKLKNKINAALQEFWKLGQRHAENEIDKAQGLAFSLKVNRNRLTFISEEFFKIKSFKVAGKLTDDAMAIISQVISNGVKGGKTFKTIETEIYQAMGSNGFLSESDYKDALGAAIDPDLVNPQARINTMLRTNGFEAVNEARYSYFTDPQLDDFVQALEYSAIMDSRTTQICQHLDGNIYSVGSPEWQSYRPPNHHNCRSLLIPVTEIDSWTESKEPTIDPQKGFA